MAHGSLDQFKAFLRRKKDRKSKSDGKFDSSGLAQSAGDLEFPEPSEEELRAVKNEIQKKASRSRVLDKIILGIIIISALAFLIYMNFYA